MRVFVTGATGYIGGAVAVALRRAGHDVVHLRDEGLQRLPDADVFQKAVREKRIVLTFDLDFGEIAAHCEEAWTSVILFRLADARSERVIARLNVALEGAATALAEGAVVVVEEARCRIRHLPIERSD